MRRKEFPLVRRLAALPLCLSLAFVSLAAAGGGASSDPATAVLSAAKTHLADSYVWGAAGPSTWDCSGLTSALWRSVGGVKDIPRTAHEQQAWAVPIPKEQALPGDLVFFGNPVTHVGLIETRTTSRSGVVLQMIDASSSNRGVVERLVWSSGTVRYGRVPRPGMVRVQPWTPPVVPAAPAPAVPAAPAPAPAPAAVRGPVTATAKGLGVLTGFQAVPRASSPVPARAARLARGWLGNATIGDVDLIRNVWHRAGGAVLPASRAGLEHAGVPIKVKDARVGDLVVYGPPGSHVGLYVGRGYMIDASRALGKVVLRRVWSAPGVHLLRITR